MAISQQQADNITQSTGHIQTAYERMESSRATLSYLINIGQATCSNVREFNLLSIAIYNYQKSMLTQARLAGQTELPSKPPTLVLIDWKGTPGSDAYKIDCSTAEMKGLRGNGLGDYLVTPRDVEWRPVPDTDNSIPPELQAIADRVKRELGGNLGEITTLTLILIGIIFVGAVATILAFDHFWNADKREESAQIRTQAEEYAKVMALRSQCFSDCMASGKSESDCAKGCSALFPKPPSRLGDWSFWAKVGLGLAVAGASIYFYKRYREQRGDGEEEHTRSPLPTEAVQGLRRHVARRLLPA